MTGFGILKHLFQLCHAVYLTLLNATCFGFLYEAMYNVEGLNKVKSCSKLQNPTMYRIKVKVNFTLEQATKDQKGIRGTALIFS